MANLFTYDSYRLFIRDLLAERNITSSSVALTLGLKSKSYLGLILRGEKRIQDEQIHAFKEIFGLNSVEFDFFYHLANWYYPTILLNASLVEPLSDHALAKALKIQTQDVEQAKKELLRLELVELIDGKIYPRSTRLKIAKKSWNQIQKKFLKSQIQNALSAFDESYEARGKFYSQTVTLAKGSFESVWEDLKDQMDRLANRSDAEASEEVVQVNLQFYRLV